MTAPLPSKTVICAALLMLAGCAKELIGMPISTNNHELELALMFEHEGCRIYRFYDSGYARYFADCRGLVSGGENHPCGKGCTRFVPNDIETAL